MTYMDPANIILEIRNDKLIVFDKLMEREVLGIDIKISEEVFEVIRNNTIKSQEKTIQEAVRRVKELAFQMKNLIQQIDLCKAFLKKHYSLEEVNTDDKNLDYILDLCEMQERVQGDIKSKKEEISELKEQLKTEKIKELKEKIKAEIIQQMEEEKKKQEIEKEEEDDEETEENEDYEDSEELPEQEVLYQPPESETKLLSFNDDDPEFVSYVKSEKCFCNKNKKKYGAIGCRSCKLTARRIKDRKSIEMREAWREVYKNYLQNL